MVNIFFTIASQLNMDSRYTWITRNIEKSNCFVYGAGTSIVTPRKGRVKIVRTHIHYPLHALYTVCVYFKYIYWDAKRLGVFRIYYWFVSPYSYCFNFCSCRQGVISYENHIIITVLRLLQNIWRYFRFVTNTCLMCVYLPYCKRLLANQTLSKYEITFGDDESSSGEIGPYGANASFALYFVQYWVWFARIKILS